MAEGLMRFRDALAPRTLRSPRGSRGPIGTADTRRGRFGRNRWELGGGPRGREALTFPSRVDEPMVLFEVLRRRVEGLIGRPCGGPLLPRQIVRLELFDSREDSLRRRPDRSAAQTAVEDLRQCPDVRAEQGRAPGQRFKCEE